jgi:hypothetical protein
VLAAILSVAVAAAAHSQGAVDVAIDAGADRHPIDPRVYGVAFADSAALTDLRVPVNRWGGNATTRHNWQANASSRASDWFFESIADGPAVAADSADSFVAKTKAGGSEPMLTIPMIGWVAKVGPGRNILASFSVAKYGPQQSTDPFLADAGNGVSTTGQNITGNDPNDANTPADPVFQRGWVDHNLSRWGAAGAGGVRYYILDNEPGIWHATHRDVHPNGTTMDEMQNDVVAYGGAIKASDPAAVVVGPEDWGWSGYLFSGADVQYGNAHGWSNLPDRSAHGNMDYLPWLLEQLRRRNQTSGARVLDIFTVHFYPQGGQFSDDTSSAMQQLRNRSTRALWDPAYVDESWIGTQVRLIPRLKEWTATYYPGTEIGITEYNWGAEDHINGATTLADVLGIYGREGVNLATYWTTPAASTPAYKAIKLYRNYDGSGSGFGETSVRAAAPNPDSLSVFAAQRAADGALTIMAINKATAGAAVNLRLSNFTAGGAVQVWRLTSSNTIARQADAAVAGATLTTTLPAQSITLFVVAGSGGGGVPRPPSNLRIVP